MSDRIIHGSGSNIGADSDAGQTPVFAATSAPMLSVPRAYDTSRRPRLCVIPPDTCGCAASHSGLRSAISGRVKRAPTAGSANQSTSSSAAYMNTSIHSVMGLSFAAFDIQGAVEDVGDFLPIETVHE